MSDPTRITAYGRTAEVEKELPDTLVVRYVDNGVQGFVPREDAEPVFGL